MMHQEFAKGIGKVSIKVKVSVRHIGWSQDIVFVIALL